MKNPLPHVLLLVTDQFRYDAVSSEITPHLHALESMNGTTTFHRAYSSTPTCTPARTALMTGKSPWSHGMLGYSTYADCSKYPETVARVFQEKGYRTVAVGKNHFGPLKHLQGYQNETLYEGLYTMMDDYDVWFNESMPNIDPRSTCSLGFNDWEACPYVFDEFFHPTAWTTRTALRTLHEHFDHDDKNTSSPLLLKVSYHRPHSPYDPPQRIFEKYLFEGSKSRLSQLDRIINDNGWDRKYKHVNMSKHAWAGDPGVHAARRSRAGYLANVEFVDEGIGHIKEFLQERNILDDFLIVWVSDHGDQNGDHYLWRKGFPWEASTHIRMVIKSPQSAGRRPKQSNALVELRDVAPTLYDFIGELEHVQYRDPLMNGKSLRIVLNGTEVSVRNITDLEHSTVYNNTVHWNALVGNLGNNPNTNCEHWKYIFNAFDKSEQLFCLENDPNETRDLAKAQNHQSIVESWRAEMVRQFEEEGRGEAWVKDGILQQRQNSSLFGSNYPCKSISSVAVLSA